MLAMPATTPLVAAPSRPARQPATLTPVAWLPTRHMDIRQWSDAGQRLGVMNRCSPWWIGDWIRYGNARFGEKYSVAARITDYDPQTLMNMVYVASRFDNVSRRRETLSWSHHEAVASLDPEEQDRWLDGAVEHKMSVADLRLELRSRRTKHKAKNTQRRQPKDVAEHQDMGIICPNCGGLVPSALFRQHLTAVTTGDHIHGG
jgi:hypothetical protein